MSMHKIINKVELTHRQGRGYNTIPVGSELRLVEYLSRSRSIIAEVNGIEFILEEGQFEEIRVAFRPPVKRKKRVG